LRTGEIINRARIVLGVVALAATALAASSASAHPAAAFPVRVACGLERWPVKTLQDRPRLIPARRVSLHYLVSRPRPRMFGGRQPFERRVFTVEAAVTLVREEEDGDIHVVLRAGSETMIAESPNSRCTTRATLHYRRAMALARDLVRVCSKARVTGVAFFDFKHGQTGLAPNAIELHPILGFHCLRQ
jgi:hypothetical protein